MISNNHHQTMTENIDKNLCLPDEETMDDEPVKFLIAY